MRLSLLDTHFGFVWLEMAGVVLESKSGPCLTDLSQELKLGRLEDWMYDIFISDQTIFVCIHKYSIHYTW